MVTVQKIGALRTIYFRHDLHPPFIILPADSFDEINCGGKTMTFCSRMIQRKKPILSLRAIYPELRTRLLMEETIISPPSMGGAGGG